MFSSYTTFGQLAVVGMETLKQPFEFSVEYFKQISTSKIGYGQRWPFSVLMYIVYYIYIYTRTAIVALQDCVGDRFIGLCWIFMSYCNGSGPSDFHGVPVEHERVLLRTIKSQSRVNLPDRLFETFSPR